MFLLNIGIGGIGGFDGAAQLGWLQKGGEFISVAISNKFGQQIIGGAAYGPFGDYEIPYREEVSGEKQEQNTLSKIWLFIKNQILTYGYMAVIPGAIVKWIKNKISPATRTVTDQNGNERHVPGEGSIFGSILGLIGNVLMYGGPVLSFVGQLTRFQEDFALGSDKAGRLQEKRISNKAGRDIYSEMSVEGIHADAADLEKKLTYRRDIQGKVFNRSQIPNRPETAFICGMSGSGKSTGAKVILSNWARKVEARNKKPVIIEISVPALVKGADELRRVEYDKAALADKAGKGVGDAFRQRASNPLLVFDMLLTRVKALIKEYKDDPKHQNEELAFFIDEYDKLGEMAKEGVDIQQLYGILTGINSLINVKEQKCPIILTANKTRAEYIAELTDVITAGLDDKQKAQVIKDKIVPHNERLGVVEIEINDPAPKEQAEILAKNLLLTFDPEVLSQIYQPAADTPFSTRIKELRDILLVEISSKYGSNLLNGRYIEEKAVPDCATTLGNIADAVRESAAENGEKRLGCTDAQWASFGNEEKINEKIKAAGCKLSIDGLRDICVAAQVARKAKAEELNDLTYQGLLKDGVAKELVKGYLRDHKLDIRERVLSCLQGDGIGADEVIKILGEIYGHDSGVFTSRGVSQVELEAGKLVSYTHGFSIDKSRGKVKIALEPTSDPRTVSGLTGFSAALKINHMVEIPLSEFTAMCTSEILSMFKTTNGNKSPFYKLFSYIFKAAEKGEKVKLGADQLADLFGDLFQGGFATT